MNSAEKWGLRVSAISAFIAAIAIGIGVWQFLEESQRNRIAAADRALVEFNRSLWEEEFRTYRDISAAVGRMVASVEIGDDGQFNQAEAAFREFYWGRAIFVESARIEKEMVKFRRRIVQFREGRLTDDQFKFAAKALGDVLKEVAQTGENAARAGRTTFSQTD